MKKQRFTETHIISILKQYKAGRDHDGTMPGKWREEGYALYLEKEVFGYGIQPYSGA